MHGMNDYAPGHDVQHNSALLDDLVDPLGRCLSPDVARRIVKLRASRKLQRRIRELGEKSDEGRLTRDEQADYETIARYIKFVSVLQSKARDLLKQEAAD